MEDYDNEAMLNVFKLRDELINGYERFSRSFTKISAADIKQRVNEEYERGRYWPEPLIQINPNYKRAQSVQALSSEGELHPLCADIFLVGKGGQNQKPLTLYQHQIEAIAAAKLKKSYVVTTGTGSGKSLSFFIPIVNQVLKNKELDDTPRTQAIVIYPMNALANSQLEELNKFIGSDQHFTVARYTGQESEAERKNIAANPPDILLTNFMMLELILTRFEEKDRRVVANCKGLEFLVLDELHTYRGRQGADVAMLVRRLKQRMEVKKLLCIGTSATMSSGSTADKKQTIAEVSSKLFGVKINTSEVINETLERVTNPTKDIDSIKPLLKSAISSGSFYWADYRSFQDDPLAIWVELRLSISYTNDKSGKPKRAKPLTLTQASDLLADDAGVSVDEAKSALQTFLLEVNRATTVKTAEGVTPFAFKLHQFISGPGKISTTLESAGKRLITLDTQRFAPGRKDDGVLLFPTHFCRECGQEYHPVWNDGQKKVEPREITVVPAKDEDKTYGFLALVSEEQYYHGHVEELPDSWFDPRREGKLNSNRKHSQPYLLKIDADGSIGQGADYWFIPEKFLFCISCGYEHDSYGKDVNRLSGLSGEGRSSATTVLTYHLLSSLFDSVPVGSDPEPDPRKLLGFTDNRQDAALQAGHFNDLIFLLVLRGGLIAALKNNGGQLSEADLADEVFKALGFETDDESVLAEYLVNPMQMGFGKLEAQRALRFVLGYRLLRDLRKGWRFNNPNLDQLKIIDVDYCGLEDFCKQDKLFAGNELLSDLSHGDRMQFSRFVFGHLRRNLCIDSRYLDDREQDKIKTNRDLNERWFFMTDEKLATAQYVVFNAVKDKRGRSRDDTVSVGVRSRLVRLIKREPFIEEQFRDSSVLEEALKHFFDAAGPRGYGYLEKDNLGSRSSMIDGWRLKSSTMIWKLTDDEEEGDKESQANVFFRALYLSIADLLGSKGHALFDFEAHEHTAQVEADVRQNLEQRFRFTLKDRREWLEDDKHVAPLQRLPVMFCSPTMELGVDISSLNTVYMRNVPPTPANYAQRSGRAGRSGQPALVVTYCAAMSPHDQWFFNHATEMVHGDVKPPTLDLTNRELIESHLQAIWLSNIEYPLSASISDLLELDQPGKPLKADLAEHFNHPEGLDKSSHQAQKVLDEVRSYLEESHWFESFSPETVIKKAASEFSKALERWRKLHEATSQQLNLAHGIVDSNTASGKERSNAQRRYHEAVRQLNILLNTRGGNKNSDFYTYRYLASQGFLPGYNFPRLPLMAWIPSGGGRRRDFNNNDGSMVSRPRFLGIYEFGPHSLIYHQGQMYRVKRVKLNISASDQVSANSELPTQDARICSECGYGHMDLGSGDEAENPGVVANVCEHCGTPLSNEDLINYLYRIESVETRPTERITVNDEERQRQGFDLQTTYRFLPGDDGVVNSVRSEVMDSGSVIAELAYAPAAQLWRVNRGWKRRKEESQLGFYINPLTGVWSKKESPDETDNKVNEGDILENVSPQRIVPFVEDHRNILVLNPLVEDELSIETMATLQAALKRGIEQTFQIEESELVVEPLPHTDNRKRLLFYEAAEGGAGVLTQLANEQGMLAQVARNALKVMHYDVPEGNLSASVLTECELKHDEQRICEAGCYQCLLSYFNQPDHERINRLDITAQRILISLANGNVKSTQAVNQAQVKKSQSKRWLSALNAGGYQQPDKTEVPIDGGKAIAIAQYRANRVLIFLSEPGESIQQYAADRGYQIILFKDESHWQEIFASYPEVFGNGHNDKVGA